MGDAVHRPRTRGQCSTPCSRLRAVEYTGGDPDVSLVLTRRALLRAALGGVVAVGLTACGRSDDDVAGAEVDGSDADAASSEALGGESIEVWRDPG
jgi:hypothetical protein